MEARIDDAVDVALEHGRTAVNGVDYHYVTAGPADGDLVLCLHGFPEFWYTWKEQLPALADADYRVVAPDVRGANRSGKPDRVAAYHLRELAADAAGLVEHFDRESARIVGHDFGGLAAWWLAATRPAVVTRLAVMNCPHLTVYDRFLRSSLTQIRKSWYVVYFQLPWLPEFGLGYDDCAVIESLYRDQVAPDALTEGDVKRFLDAAARDGALTGMVNWYRATGRWYLRRLLRGGGLPNHDVSVPTLLCWGERDHALSAGLIDDHATVVADLDVARFPDAGHWVQFDATDRVNDALLGFL